MSGEVLEKVIREIVSVAENTEFIWHGGEPLLAGIGFYQKVLALQQRYGLFCIYTRNSIQTNGTLLEEDWAAFFKENNFRVSLSLDGPKEIHNTHRKYPSKQGSFHDVIQAIENLNKYKKSFGIVAVIHGRTLYSPDDLLDFFSQNSLLKLSINPGLNESGLSAETYAELMCRLFDAWLDSNQPELQISLFDGLVQSFLGLSHNMCCWNGNCPGIIQMDQAGDVWPCCDRYLPFAQYKHGNIRQNTLADILSDTAYTKFRDTFGNLPTRCMKCEWNHICKGGCAYQRLINGQGKDSEDPLCQAYKQIFQYTYDKYQDICPQIQDT
jgi:uncharacterized protein